MRLELSAGARTGRTWGCARCPVGTMRGLKGVTHTDRKILLAAAKKRDWKMLDGGPPWWLGQLGFHAPTAGSLGSIPGQGTKILHATWWAKPKKKKIPDRHWGPAPVRDGGHRPGGRHRSEEGEGQCPGP